METHIPTINLIKNSIRKSVSQLPVSWDVNRENRSEREYKLVVIWKLLDDHISVREHKIIVRNMLKPQMRDLMAAIKEVYPYLEREKFSLYCRYGGSELYPIFDHMTMVTAFALMDAHESPLLYLIRKDIGEWINKHPQLMKNPSDIRLLFEAKHPERWSTEYNRGRAEHVPDGGTDGARVSSAKKRPSAQAKAKDGGRRSSQRKSKAGGSRKSMGARKSKTGGSRKSMGPRKSKTK